MKRSVGRRVRDAVLACAGLGLVITGIVIIDESARQLLLGAIQGNFQIGAVVDTRLFGLMRGMKDFVARGHHEMTTFAVAGFVLFVMMFKL
jgi:hypothetical protein